MALTSRVLDALAVEATDFGYPARVARHFSPLAPVTPPTREPVEGWMGVLERAI